MKINVKDMGDLSEVRQPKVIYQLASVFKIDVSSSAVLEYCERVKLSMFDLVVGFG